MIHQRNNEINETDAERLLRYLRGRASSEEKKVVEEWINDNPENEKLALQIGEIYYAQYTRNRMNSYDPYPAYEKNRMRRKNKRIKQLFRNAGIVAACIAGLISISIPFIYDRAEHTPSQIQYVTVCTNPGMRTSFNLPDGTFVYLNSASKLVYPIPYDPQERRVCLEGEAYFEVESNEKHPFVVSVGNDKMRVKVTGTTFNLAAYPGEPEIYTTLVEGSVDVQIMNESAKGKFRTLSDTTKQAVYSYDTDNLVIAQRTLKPSEKVTYNSTTQKVTVKHVTTSYECAWKEGKLIFKDTPIPEVLQKMSNFYNVRFEVKDPVIETYRFTGVFDNKQLSQVLDYIQLTNKIKYTIKTTTEDDSNSVKYTTIILEKKV